MKPKRRTKLNLSGETIRTLAANDLKNVGGALATCGWVCSTMTDTNCEHTNADCLTTWGGCPRGGNSYDVCNY